MFIRFLLLLPLLTSTLQSRNPALQHPLPLQKSNRHTQKWPLIPTFRPRLFDFPARRSYNSTPNVLHDIHRIQVNLWITLFQFLHAPQPEKVDDFKIFRASLFNRRQLWIPDPTLTNCPLDHFDHFFLSYRPHSCLGLRSTFFQKLLRTFLLSSPYISSFALRTSHTFTNVESRCSSPSSHLQSLPLPLALQIQLLPHLAESHRLRPQPLHDPSPTGSAD